MTKLGLFMANAKTIKYEFTWNGDMPKRMAALLFTHETRFLKIEPIRALRGLVKKSGGEFSSLRGNLSLCFAAQLSLSLDPKQTLAEAIKIYDLLKSAGFRQTGFLAFAALEIAQKAKPANYAVAVERSRAFFDAIKECSVLLSGEDDAVFAAMLGLSDLDVADGTKRIESLYGQLKGEFRHMGDAKALAKVLVLGGSDHEMASRFLALRDALRAAQGINFEKTYAVAFLGVLALLPASVDTIDATVSDFIYDLVAIRDDEIFSNRSYKSQEAILITTAVMVADYLERAYTDILTVNSSRCVNTKIAQQAVAMAVVAASALAPSTKSEKRPP